jgi:predicted nucleic acid-binding protein
MSVILSSNFSLHYIHEGVRWKRDLFGWRSEASPRGHRRAGLRSADCVNVLVDTSVWIGFLYGRQPFLSAADKLMEERQAAGHELVYGELLMGDVGGRKRFLREYERIEYARTIPHHEVVTFVEARKLHGRGVGWVDVHLLASALAAHMQLWTADPRLAAIADEFGVAYKPSSA